MRRWKRRGPPGHCGSRCGRGRPSFDDAVHGTITFDGANIEDFVILRSDGHPTYHLSVVVDDVEMAITHVIRGDDHISNTPKHVLLFEALGAAVPRFAHVPLILGADKKRLSKRHGATSVMEYERQGYFSAAMVNFLALLGWAPGDDRELLSKTDLIEAFSLEAISGGNAVFNTEKLDWMNGQYISRMSPAELSTALAPRLAEAGLADTPIARDPRRFERLLELLRPRAKRLPDFIEQARPLLIDEVEFAQEAIDKHLSTPRLSDHLATLRRDLAAAEPFDEPTLEATLRNTATSVGHQGRRAHPRDARGSHWAHHEPRDFRGAGAARARDHAGPPGPSASVSSGARLKDSYADGESSADLHARSARTVCEPYSSATVA